MTEEVEQEKPQFNTEIKDGVYKKWHKTGFINIGYWAKANKVTVEIGALAGGDGGLASATKVFLPGYEFLAYLRSEISKTCGHLRPDFATKGYEKFGGGMDKKFGGIVARVFSSKMAQDREGNQLPSARMFKCGVYEGVVEGEGAIRPIYAKKINENFIRLNMVDLAEIFEVINLMMVTAHVTGLVKEDDR